MTRSYDETHCEVIQTETKSDGGILKLHSADDNNAVTWLRHDESTRKTTTYDRDNRHNMLTDDSKTLLITSNARTECCKRYR